ncbi:MAG: CotH kinase family protein, partial [Clostridia bacterium]|nr:CotH kinase family protein [Clostridia bacterium]
SGKLSAIEKFGLAEEVASIDIVTADGQDVTGDEDNQPYKKCSVTLTNGREGEDFADLSAQVRIRGNNTATYDKKSFRLKFDKKTNLLGLNGGAECKNWVLLACYKDVTFLRDAVTFEFAKQSLAENGYYTSDYSFAEVSINGSYNGLYLVAEQQQVNSNRVDIFEPADGYTGTDIGYLVEFDGNAYKEDPSTYFRVDYSSTPLICEDGTKKVPSQYPENFFASRVSYTVKNDITNSAQFSFIQNYTQNVFKILYDAIYNGKYTTFNANYTAVVPASYQDARSTVEAVVNLDSWVDMFLLQELACDNDIDWSSFFFSVDMSKSGDKKLTFQAPWDFDSGYGMMKGLEELDKIFTANAYTTGQKGLNLWTALPAHADWFMQAVAERFAELKEDGVFTRLITLIDVVTETYEPYFEKNYEKWDNLGKIVDTLQSNQVTTFTTHADAAKYLRDWLSHRIDFLDGYFADLLK